MLDRQRKTVTLDLSGLENQKNCDRKGLNAMQLYSVALPNGKEVKMVFDVGTAMMDVLVRVTIEHGISAGGMALKVPADRPPGYIHYKPNTPIGVLNCSSLEVVPKATLSSDRPRNHQSKMVRRAFEPSIRVLIDLPQRQKTMLRVPPHTRLSEILRKACEDANLGSPESYQLLGAKSGHGFPLRLDLELRHVGTAEFVVASKPTISKAQSQILFGSLSSCAVNIQEEEKQGCFRSFFKSKKRTNRASSQWSVAPSVRLPEPAQLASSDCEIPSEPLPPPPVPPGSTASKKRPAPAPPSQRSLISSRSNSRRESEFGSEYPESAGFSPSASVSVAGDSEMYLKPVDSFDTRDRSNSDFLSVNNDHSIRTMTSSRSAPGQSALVKKRRAPPPPPGYANNNTLGVQGATGSQMKSSSTPALSQNTEQTNQALNSPSRGHVRQPSIHTGIAELLQSPCNSPASKANSIISTKSPTEVSNSPLIEETTDSRSVDWPHTMQPPAITIVNDSVYDVPVENVQAPEKPSSTMPATENPPLAESASGESMRTSSKFAIVFNDPMHGGPFQPQLHVSSFEDEYYSKQEPADYARTMRLEKERHWKKSNGKRWEIPSVQPSSISNVELQKNKNKNKSVHSLTNGDLVKEERKEESANDAGVIKRPPTAQKKSLLSMHWFHRTKKTMENDRSEKETEASNKENEKNPSTENGKFSSDNAPNSPIPSPPPPPPPLSIPPITNGTIANNDKVSKNLPNQDSRTHLMQSIRNFGGIQNLRKAGNGEK